MQIGPYSLSPPVFLAPMAGVSDQPFRQLCRRLGAGLAVSEMVSADPRLWDSRKTRLRRDHAGEVEPRSVQILGADPRAMAEAARFNADQGAQLIDLNMGCPARKVCGAQAGSALLRDEALVGRILEAVVAAVTIPVTLKIRTGWDRTHRNGVAIARIAEQAGIQALAVHGRTRACGYSGDVDYAGIRAIKQAVAIPVIANGDIDRPAKARWVLDFTGADAVMIGRGAQGRPWIFREIAHFLATGEPLPPPAPADISAWVAVHLQSLYAFYGARAGVRIARKHLAWYSQPWPDSAAFRARVNLVETHREQLRLARDFFERLVDKELLAA
ncbi:MAG: tRNA dihydrouridine synthase DusB [Candidatus Competibacter sp.]|nr:tRNA dihydrouridine synthase DusB [Candidatus Competibacter sp.]MDG4606728.1 tRNA dihydrouridine synthase DusB [Candidatus Contendobacter sp.]HRD49881.1 tRNA dihydrouridine synthase DusB [Candidatus Contendobacter sp.]